MTIATRRESVCEDTDLWRSGAHDLLGASAPSAAGERHYALRPARLALQSRSSSAVARDASARPGQSPRRARRSRGRDDERARSRRARERPLSKSPSFTLVVSVSPGGEG